MGPILIGLGGQEPIGCIGCDDAAAEGHVAQNAMDVQRIPEGRMNDVPDVAEEPPLLIHPGRGHHEADPRIRQEHEHRTDHVQDDRHAQVDPLQEPLLHLVPPVVVDVEGSALRHEHQRIDVHDRTEDAGEIAEERGVERQEGEDQDTAQDGRQRIGRQADLHEVVGQLIVLLAHRLILRDHPHELNNHAEDRHGQHEAAVIEVLLVGEPEQHAALEVVSRIVLRAVGRLWRGRPHDHSLGLVIDIARLLDLCRILPLTVLLGRIRRRRRRRRLSATTGEGRQRDQNGQEEEADHRAQRHECQHFVPGYTTHGLPP